MAIRTAIEGKTFSQPADQFTLQTQLDVGKCFMFQKQKWIIENLSEKEPDNDVTEEFVLKKVQQHYKLAVSLLFAKI